MEGYKYERSENLNNPFDNKLIIWNFLLIL